MGTILLRTLKYFLKIPSPTLNFYSIFAPLNIFNHEKHISIRGTNV